VPAESELIWSEDIEEPLFLSWTRMSIKREFASVALSCPVVSNGNGKRAANRVPEPTQAAILAR